MTENHFSQFNRLRELYKPERIEVLFVAESPPEPNLDEAEVRFFYNARREDHDYLYRALMEVVFPDEFRYERGQKESGFASSRKKVVT